MRYAQQIITGDFNPKNKELRFSRCPQLILYEVNNDDIVVRMIYVRPYEKTVSLYDLNEFGADVALAMPGRSIIGDEFMDEVEYELLSIPTTPYLYSKFPPSEFKEIWEGRGSFKGCDIIKIWEKQFQRYKVIGYVKLHLKDELVNNTPKIVHLSNYTYYEVEEWGRVSRKIEVRKKERTITLSRRDKNPITGHPCDESLNEIPIYIEGLSKVSNESGLALIDKAEFLAAWDGSADVYNNYEIVKRWSD